MIKRIHDISILSSTFFLSTQEIYIPSMIAHKLADRRKGRPGPPLIPSSVQSGAINRFN